MKFTTIEGVDRYLTYVFNELEYGNMEPYIETLNNYINVVECYSLYDYLKNNPSKNYIMAYLIEISSDIPDYINIAISLLNDEIKSGNYRAYNTLGYILYKNGNTEKAFECYVRSIEHGFVVSYENIASYYIRKNDYDNSIKYSIVGIKNKNYESYYHLSFSYLKMRKFDNAIKYALLGIDHGSYLCYTILTTIYYNMSDYRKVRQYSLLLIEKGGNPSYKILGTSCLKMGEIGEALIYYKKAYDEDPSDINENNIKIVLRKIKNVEREYGNSILDYNIKKEKWVTACEDMDKDQYYDLCKEYKI